MRYILLFLSLFTFIFSKDKEVENEMGYNVYFAMNGGTPAPDDLTDVAGTVKITTRIKKIYKILGGNL